MIASASSVSPWCPLRETAELFNRHKFEACVLRLYDPEADRILKAARNSPSNRRLVVYGIARNTQEAFVFGLRNTTRSGRTLDRQSVLKVVRATHLLVIGELRRYVGFLFPRRLEIDLGNRAPVMATAVEVSSGGMSVRCNTPLPKSDPVRLPPVLCRGWKS